MGKNQKSTAVEIVFKPNICPKNKITYYIYIYVTLPLTNDIREGMC